MDPSSEQEQAAEPRAIVPSAANDAETAQAVEGGDLLGQLPPAIAPLFSNPPVLWNEDANAYKKLLDEVASTMRPKDLIEFLWLRDFTDLTWEILRYRRVQKAIIEAAQPALRARSRTLLDNGRPTAAELEQSAAQFAHAWGYTDTRQELESVDKLLAAVESRRNKILREIESRREGKLKLDSLYKKARRNRRRCRGTAGQAAVTPSAMRSGAAAARAHTKGNDL